MTQPPRSHGPKSEPSEEPKAGLFRLDRNNLEPMLAAANELELACFHVDLKDARNIPGFIKAMKRDLALPSWFGNNLDALNDGKCILACNIDDIKRALLVDIVGEFVASKSFIDDEDAIGYWEQFKDAFGITEEKEEV